MRNRTRSAHAATLLRRCSDRLAKLADRIDRRHAGETSQALAVLEIDRARIDLDHAFRRLGLELRRGVAGEDDGRHAAFASLGEDVGDEIVGNAVDEFRDRVRSGGRDDQRMIDSVVELSDSAPNSPTCRDRRARRFGRSSSCLYMRRTSPPALLRKRSTCSSSWIKAQAFLQEMAGSRERPSPARRLAFDHLAAGGRSFGSTSHDFRKYRAPQPFREFHAIGWRREPGAHAALLEIARE